MKKNLVTGGSGVLGKELCKILSGEKIPFLIAGRKKPMNDLYEWKHLDLESDEGFDDLLEETETVFHLASATANWNAKVDVDGTKKLLDAAKQYSIKHFIYISIVGTDLVPMKYYRIKAATEKVIQQSGFQNFSILRATQFHDLIDGIFTGLNKYPFIFIPKNLKVQPIEAGVVAKRLFQIFRQPPSRQIENIGGNEILFTQQMMRTWLDVLKSKKKMISLPLPFSFARKIATGALTCRERAEESCTWQQWLEKKYLH
ncbi:MAG TPA: NAD(P)H-binding protein [Chitinophagales bacterium]|nr:NAD(P)H-binding protein [Chitinophagales bacterium]